VGGRRAGGGGRRAEAEGGGGSAQPKTRTPHKDVGKQKKYNNINNYIYIYIPAKHPAWRRLHPHPHFSGREDPPREDRLLLGLFGFAHFLHRT